MEHERRNWSVWLIVALTAVVAGVIMSGTFRRTTHITLPSSKPPLDYEQEAPGTVNAIIAVTPDTVQAAIASMERPESYSRTITIEQFWDGGSLSYEVLTSVKGALTRTERTLADGQIRHSVTDGESTWIWYDNADVYCAAAGTITADLEQMIPTYEEVLELPKQSIKTADFRTLSEINCIYVETEPDEGGCVSRYWISLDIGLLCAAERLLDEVTVYRMAALEANLQDPGEEAFVLPNGNSLL